MRKKILMVVFLTAIIVSMGFFHSLKVYSEGGTAVEKGVNYLKLHPQTAWSSMALAASNETVIDLSHLQSVPQEQKSATTYAKNILALVANGKNPTNFGSEDYVEKLRSYYQDNQFGDKTLLNDDVWAILALGSIGKESLSQVQAAKDYLLTFQNSDGGWGYATSSQSDTNSTAAVIMALLETGTASDSPEIIEAVDYLKTAQNDDGGFSYSAGDASDSCSGAWVISTIYKLGQDPADSVWTKNGNNPSDSLVSFQDEDGGFWWQAEGDNKFCTSYAVLALLGKSYPVATNFNTHKIRIEGETATLCNVETAGGTAMDLVVEAADSCSYAYTIVEYPEMGLYLSELAGETSWMYTVNNISAMKGADNYYLDLDDVVLWYSGEWLDNGWSATKVELTKTETQAVVQAKYYNVQTSNWDNLLAQVKIQIGSEEMTTDSSGMLILNLNSFENGLYPVFVKRQIVSGFGYIRSEKENLSIGITPEEHQVGLKVEIERVQAIPGGEQESISFSLSPSLLDFGKLKAGESSVQDLTLINGNSKVYLQPEVTGDDIFIQNLDIDRIFWRSFSAILEENQQKVFEVKLSIPSGFGGDMGIKQGELTFWAIKQ